MCLTVKKGTHRMVAETNLKVYKCLDYSPFFKYQTPFQFMRINFNEKGQYRFEMDSNLIAVRPRTLGGYEVGRGIHAYHVKLAADETSSKFHEDSGTATHYAVIPKGSHYYIGEKRDIVSNQMIIFKSKKDFDKYAEENEVKPVK